MTKQLFNINHNFDLGFGLNEYDQHHSAIAWNSTTVGNAHGSARVTIANTVNKEALRLFTQIADHNYSFRIEINTTALTSTAGSVFNFAEVRYNSTSLVALQLRQQSSTFDYRMRVRGDGGFVDLNWITGISDAEHTIEGVVKQASSNSANDGEAYFYIDGTLRDSDTAIDLFDLSKPNRWVSGAVFIDSAVSGYLYLGGTSMRDDWQRIGDSVQTSGQTYHIKPSTGSDSNTGLSEAQAWASLDKLRTSMNSSTFVAGDTILLYDDETFTPTSYQVNIKNIIGTSPTTRFTIKRSSTGTNKPIIDCTSNSGYSIFYSQTDEDCVNHVTIEGVNFTNGGLQPVRIAGDTNQTEGGLVWDWLVKDCDFGNSGNVIQSVGTKIKDCLNIEMVGCTYYVEEEAIYAGLSTGQITACVYGGAYDCQIDSAGWEGVDLKPDCVGFNIRKVIIDDTGDSGITVRGSYHHIRDVKISGVGSNSLTNTTGTNRAGIWCIDSYNDLDHNIVELTLVQDVNLDNGTPTRAYGIIWNGENSYMRKCTLDDNDTAGVLARVDTGATYIKNCIFSNNDDYGLFMDAGYSQPEGNYNLYYNNNGGNDSIYDEAGGNTYTVAQAGLNMLFEINSPTEQDPGFIDAVDYELNTSSNAYELGNATSTNIGNITYDGTAPSVGYHEPTRSFPNHAFADNFDGDTAFDPAWTSTTGATIDTGSNGTSGANCAKVTVSGTSQGITTALPFYSYAGRSYAYFQLNLDNITIPTGGIFTLYSCSVCVIYAGYDGTNKFLLLTLNDSSSRVQYSNKINFSSGFHSVEVEYIQAPIAGGWGQTRLWLDGDLAAYLFGMSTDPFAWNSFQFSVNSPTSGTTGYILIDDVILDDTSPVAYTGSSLTTVAPGGSTTTDGTPPGSSIPGTTTDSTTGSNITAPYHSILAGSSYAGLSFEILDTDGDLVIDPELTEREFYDVKWSVLWPKGDEQLSLSFYKKYPQAALSVKSRYRITAKWLDKKVWSGLLQKPMVQEDNNGVLITLTAFGDWQTLESRYIDKRWVDDVFGERLDRPADGSRDTDNDQNRAVLTSRNNRFETRLAVNDSSVDLGVKQFYLEASLPPGSYYQKIESNYYSRTGEGFSVDFVDVDGGSVAISTLTISGASAGVSGTHTATFTNDTNTAQIQIGAAAGIGTDTYNGDDVIIFNALTAYSKYNSSHPDYSNPTYTIEQIIKDVVYEALNGVISTDFYIASGLNDGDAVGAFVTDGLETVSSVLERATRYSNSSLDTYGAEVTAIYSTSDNLPKLIIRKRDVSTPLYVVPFDFEYMTFAPWEDETQVWNYIRVVYTNDRGKEVYVDPDDTSTLKDASSISTYGRREKNVMDLGQASQDDAIAYGRRYLEYNKDGARQATFRFQQLIRLADGSYQDVAEVRTPFAIQVLGYNNDEVFWVREMEYDHASRSVSFSSDQPPDQWEIFKGR